VPDRRRIGRRLVVGVAVAACIAAACGGTAPESSRSSASSTSGDIVVFAASSLADAFAAIGDAFSEANPGLSVRFQFAGSSELAAQLVNEAPANVFAAADETNMATVVDAGRVSGTPIRFATNTMQIVTAAGNPLNIASLADLADPALTVVLCAEEAPCGRYSRRMLDAADVTVTPKSLEQSVKAVLSKVSLGEADAGIVYRTDVIAAGEVVAGVDIDPSVVATATYPIVAVVQSSAAAAFIDFVLSAEGQRILAEFGFGAP
jgi:molybdate transport system substrate-binding protein